MPSSGSIERLRTIVWQDEALRFMEEGRAEVRLLRTDFLMPGAICAAALAVKAMTVIPGLPIVVTLGVAGTAYNLGAGRKKPGLRRASGGGTLKLQCEKIATFYNLPSSLPFVRQSLPACHCLAAS